MPAYLTEADVARVLTPAVAANAVEGSFARLARGEVDNPPRVRLPIPDGQFAVMPCVDRGLGLAGLKTFAWTPGGTPFLVVLMTIHEPEIVAVLEADTLGQLRTAAASAVAAKHLARAGASSLGVIGCGRQAASHVAALRAQLPSLQRVVVYCRDAGSRNAFCSEHDCEPASVGTGRRRLRRRRHSDHVGHARPAGRLAERRRTRARRRRQRSARARARRCRARAHGGDLRRLA